MCVYVLDIHCFKFWKFLKHVAQFTIEVVTTKVSEKKNTIMGMKKMGKIICEMSVN